MTPAEFRALCVDLYGQHTAAEAAADLGVTRKAVERYFSGTRKVPGYILKSIEKTQRLREVERISDENQG